MPTKYTNNWLKFHESSLPNRESSILICILMVFALHIELDYKHGDNV